MRGGEAEVESVAESRLGAPPEWMSYRPQSRERSGACSFLFSVLTFTIRIHSVLQRGGTSLYGGTT